MTEEVNGLEVIVVGSLHERSPCAISETVHGRNRQEYLSAFSRTDIPVCPCRERTIAEPAHGPIGLPLVETRSP